MPSKIDSLGVLGLSPLSINVSTSNSAYSGGIAGYMATNSSITGSYATGDVSATATGTSTAFSGGIAGWMESNSSITGSYATGDVTATAGSTAFSGGIAGFMVNTSSITVDSGRRGRRPLHPDPAPLTTRRPLLAIFFLVNLYYLLIYFCF